MWAKITFDNTFWIFWIFEECYLEHFERFLENFGIGFARDACVENGIDNLEIFLMLEKDDVINILGLNIWKTLKCIEAKGNFAIWNQV